ncbi:RNA polymerase sigma factor [Myxococcus xanthus]|nr:RNA polymerase sigma factor [Myxococcus xanthus]
MGRVRVAPRRVGGVLGPETSDERLMLAFQAGDARAFETLVRKHRTPVFNFILRFTGHRARAEDVLQETWLKVVRSAGDYTPKAKFTTWLYTIARNLCVDSARKESYRQASSLEAPAPGAERDESRPLGEGLPDAGASPERGAYNARLRPLLERALATLPDEQREVFTLREYSGIPFKDIAEVTGVSENTVKSRMRYALDGLRRRLAEMGVDGDLAEDGRTVVG